MRILSLQLKNIKSHNALELHFSPGINVLSGPNGVGKSTIFEAIGYALFGVDAQSFVGNVERFISIGAKKGEIALVFEVAAGRFRVSRTVGSPANWLLAREVGGAFEVEEHKDIKETEARLKELLGLESGRSLAEQFELVIGPFQHEFLGPFVIRQPSKRRDKFDEILGIDTWRKTFSHTGALLKAIANRIKVLESAIGPLQDQVEALPERRAAHKTVREQLKQTRQEFKARDQAFKALQKRLVEVDRCEQAFKALAGQVDKLKERVTNGREKIASQKSLIGEALKAQKIMAENLAGKQACELAEKKLITLRERAKQQRLQEQQLAALEKESAALGARHQAESKAIDQVAEELAKEELALQDRRGTLVADDAQRTLASRLPELQEIGKALHLQLGQLAGRRAGLKEGEEKLSEGICPFFHEPCLNIAERPPGDLFSARFAQLADEHQRLDNELAHAEQQEQAAHRASEQLKGIETQLKALDEQAAGLANRRQSNDRRATGLKTILAEQTSMGQQLTEARKSLAAFATLATDIEAAEAEKKQHQTARDLYLAHQVQAAKLEELQDNLAKFEQLLAELQADLSEKEAALIAADQAYDEAQHQTLRQEKDERGREVGALEQKVSGLETEDQRLVEEIERLKEIEKNIAEKKARIKKCAAQESLVKFLRNRVFRNVSGYLSERFREEISQRANRIYRTIAEVDEELAWGDNYQLILRDMVDGKLRERADDQLSGGQTMSAVVALRLAMLQTIGARIAFFDEPTSNLDAARRENLAQAFRSIDIGKEEVTEHWYDQLFLISHDVAFTEVTDQILDLTQNQPSDF